MELSESIGNVTLGPSSPAVFSSQCALRSLLFLELQVQVYMFYSFLEGKKLLKILTLKSPFLSTFSRFGFSIICFFTYFMFSFLSSKFQSIDFRLSPFLKLAFITAKPSGSTALSTSPIFNI